MGPGLRIHDRYRAFVLTAFVMALIHPSSAFAIDAQPRRNTPDWLLAPPPEASLAAAPRYYRLRKADKKGEAFVCEAEAFTAHIAEDGTVRFDDHHLKLSLVPPWLPSPPPPGTPTLEGMLRRRLRIGPKVAEKSTSAQGVPRTIMPKASHYHSDRSGLCTYPDPCYFEAKVLLINVTGTFDLTDALTLLNGKDPFRIEKARFLEATRDLRVQLTIRSQAENMRRGLTNLSQALREITCDKRLTLTERRAALEAFRKEMDESVFEGKIAVDLINQKLKEWPQATYACEPSTR